MATNSVKRIIMKLLGTSNVLNRLDLITNKINRLEQDRALIEEIHNSQLFHDLIIDSKWLIYKNFKPGGWAVDYGVLCTLYQVLNTIKPNNILEFGLGQSSKMIHQYAQYYNAQAVTVEHDVEWIDFFTAGKDGDYSINIKRLNLETISYKGCETLTYKGIRQELGNQKFDFIMVDAPFGSDHYSRSQIIEIVKFNLKESFCIIMDDYERLGERETIEEVIKWLDQNNIQYVSKTYSSSKQHHIICSKDYVFLTSL